MITDSLNLFRGEVWDLAWDYERGAEARFGVEPMFYLPIVDSLRDGSGEIRVMNALNAIGTIKDTVFEIPTVKEMFAHMLNIHVPG
jgi:hypothetical protein